MAELLAFLARHNGEFHFSRKDDDWVIEARIVHKGHAIAYKTGADRREVTLCGELEHVLGYRLRQILEEMRGAVYG